MLPAETPPTLIPLAPTPVIALKEDLPPGTVIAAGPETGEQRETLPEATALAIVESPVEIVPTPAGVGVRPGLAQQYWVPDAGPEARVDWRPPPYDVPLSIHEDEHYWLIRPIPSGRRNYDLEWYPYGNDVLLPHLPPYRIHHGADFPNDTGAPILAASSGMVIHAGTLPSPRNGVNYYGNTVIIRHDWQWRGQDVYTLYAHTLELFVAVGDTVEQGQLIAGVGSSGEVSGPHLHLEVRVGSNHYSNTRNPALWLAPYEGWGTLAGRFMDKKSRLIPGAELTVKPVDVATAVRKQLTYDLSVTSDEVWQENFVVGDLPAGQYELTISAPETGIIYLREFEILPGRTRFELIQTEFDYVPTSTPEPTPTPGETPDVDSTVTEPTPEP
ncbi:MAG TPA: peptidoglycan DD-metalloendopeptidase family protein [Anaerolineae bacterium]